jgi:predicted kinase
MIKLRPTITFLVGPPASGKSTWVSKNSGDATIISRDDILDKLRKDYNLSYVESFSNQELQNKVNSELNNHIAKSLKSIKDIIVDMTNMNKRSRSFILNKVPDIYTKNAVVFNVPKPELLRRLKKREMETGKSIPLHVVDSFIDSYEKPTNSEFDNIIYN